MSRGLLAVTLLTALISLCPCPTGMEAAMDDCCLPTELSMSGLCCAPETASAAATSPAPALVSASMEAMAQAAPVAAAPFFSPGHRDALVRSTLAHPILRI